MDSQTATPKQQIVERLKSAQNIVVTVNRQPTVDEYAAAIGLSRLLNTFGKRVSTVISTSIPPVLKFLKAEPAVSTDFGQLRDLVIELDKEKADKLRYKAEKDVVKVFITPYKTALSEKDLRFSQGDYNVDTIVVIGATSREQLDPAVLEHSQILRDATILTLSVGDKQPAVGTVSWHEPTASSVAELLVSVADALQTGLLDSESSKALLTAIIAATDGFKGKATSPKVMTIAAQLMASGADQQAIMREFEHLAPIPEDKADGNQPVDSGDTLAIAHQDEAKPAAPVHTHPEPNPVSDQPQMPHMMITPEVKPPSEPKPPAKRKKERRHRPRLNSQADSHLAADSIDAIMDSARQINAEMDKAITDVDKTASAVNQSATMSHAGAEDNRPKNDLKQPVPTHPVPEYQHQLDQARQAVSEAVAAHPEASLPVAVESLGAQNIPGSDGANIDHTTGGTATPPVTV